MSRRRLPARRPLASTGATSCRYSRRSGARQARRAAPSVGLASVARAKSTDAGRGLERRAGVPHPGGGLLPRAPQPPPRLALRDAPARQQVEHLALPQPLAGLKRGLGQPPLPFDERELDVHIPLVRPKRGPVLRQREISGSSLDLPNARTQLARGLRERTPAPEGARQARVQLPSAPRWSGAEAGDRAPVERFRRECPSRAHFEIAERRKRFGFVLSRSQGAEGVNRVPKDPSCGRGVPAPPSGQADSQSDLCPVLRISGRPQQEPFEYDLSALIALTFQEHARHPKLRKKLLLLLLNSRALREPLRAPVLPLGFGQFVELEREIRARADLAF